MHRYEIEQTEELRRLALQLALQLPANVADARRVIGLTSTCLDQFLVDGRRSDARTRAARLGWPVDIEASLEPTVDERRPTGLPVLLCCLAALALSCALAMLLIDLFGAGAGAASVLSVMVSALLYGRRPAVLVTMLAAIAVNLVAVPPLDGFTPPAAWEVVTFGLNLSIAIAVPWILARRETLRASTLRLAARPLRVFIGDRADVPACAAD